MISYWGIFTLSIPPACPTELRYRGSSGKDYTAQTEKSLVDSEGHSAITGEESTKAETRTKCPWTPESRVGWGGASGAVRRKQGF